LTKQPGTIRIRHSYWNRVLWLATAIGAVSGFFLLYPINEYVYYYEHYPHAPTVWAFILGQLVSSLKGNTPQKTVFYTLVGAALGLAMGLFFNAWQKKQSQIQTLRTALGENLGALIAQGEGPRLEFKSSFRWDRRQNRVNRSLEGAVLKTLAGFMNSQGGTLLIGVEDGGEISGLEKDFATLKKKSRDGFELAVMTAVSTKLGPEFCRHLDFIFHRIEDKDVCRIIVAPAQQPVFVKQDRATRFYLRTGGSTRELNIQEALSYVSSRRK